MTVFLPSYVPVIRFGSKQKLSVAFIQQTHKLITNGFRGTSGENPGEFRIGPIFTGSNSNYPPPQWVEPLMEEFVEWTNKKLDGIRNLNTENVLRFVAEFHYRFVGIHPFWDGNGRITRLFMCALLMLAGLPIIAIDPSAQWRYINLLQKISKSEVPYHQPILTYYKDNLWANMEKRVPMSCYWDPESLSDQNKIARENFYLFVCKCLLYSLDTYFSVLY
jgi:fido (protein-threonine AMPylation protein)